MDIIILGPKTSLLQTELLGRPFSEYLTSAILTLSKKFVDMSDTPINLYDGKDKADKRLVKSKGVLLVDAAVWVPIKTLRKICKLISGEKKLTIFGTKVFLDKKNKKFEILGIYYPPNLIQDLRSELSIAPVDITLKSLSNSLKNSKVVRLSEPDDLEPTVHVRSLLDLALLEKAILFSRALKALQKGIRIRDPYTVFLRGDLTFGSDVEIDMNVIIEGKVHLGDGVKVGAHSILSNSMIGSYTEVRAFSIIEDAVVGKNSFIGPYGRIRPGTVIKDFVQIGNFVEIKNSEVNAGSRINHLSFIGDAMLEENVTIGAGVITCNHNGVTVCKTYIESGAYIGSGSQLIAPLKIGKDAIIGAGSTITEDAPEGKLTLARSRQVSFTRGSVSKPDTNKK